MINTITEADTLKFKSLSQEEKVSKGILGRLYGPVASFTLATRNDRKYTQELWEKLFDSELIREKFENGGIFGQLCHPDYEEVDMEKVACIMPTPPVKDNNGNLIAYVDILDTPCGKVAYQLAKYGYKFGISSRGTGDIIEGIDGDEVDPDTYQLNAFDLVETPAVKAARLTFTESLANKKRYNKTLTESLNDMLLKAGESERELMVDSLESLGFETEEVDEPDIDFNSELNKLMKKYNVSDDDLKDVLDSRKVLNEKEPCNEECTSESCADKVEEVVDDKSEELVAELQEAILRANKLEKDNLSLQEKLSVRIVKGKELEEQIASYKETVVGLKEELKNKCSTDAINLLNEKLAQSNKRLSKSKELTEEYKTRLDEAKAELDSLKSIHRESATKLTEAMDTVESLKKQLNRSKQVEEKLRSNFNILKENYLSINASYYSINVDELKRSLGESFTIKGVKDACKTLSHYNTKISKLPFNIINENTKFDVKCRNESLVSDEYDRMVEDDKVSDILRSFMN